MDGKFSSEVRETFFTKHFAEVWLVNSCQYCTHIGFSLLNENYQSCRIYSDVGKGLSERIMKTGASDWSTLITWPEYWPLIGQFWSSIARVFFRLEPSHGTEPPSWDMNTPWSCLNISASSERKIVLGKEINKGFWLGFWTLGPWPANSQRTL